ncbi:27 kDa hemolymph protein-like [Athalia rosae]|uniref:27 kDa hemolymph protein-like n=1 Tax=Athalia rosae TaxID=37344 RepID=UPI0020346751|nr:27 kDa hemolymph protein-like [Athalia rosae]
MKNFSVNLLSFVLVGTLCIAAAQDHIPTQDEILQAVPDLNRIPYFENLNASGIKTEEVERLMREKCTENGGPNAFEQAKSSPGEFQTCMQALLNVTQIQAEMEEARERNALDDVFEKYCRKVPDVKKCVRSLGNNIELCLDSEERENIVVINNMTSSLLEFICHDQGDRIAMFIAAGGPECISSKQTALDTCMKDTVANYLPAANSTSGTPGLPNLPSFVLGIKECTDISRLQTCAVKVLEDCEDPTPANVVDALFTFVKKVTPCENLLKGQPSPTADNHRGGNKNGVAATGFNSLVLTIATAIFLRFA